MAYKHCCVINAQGYYRFTVLVTSRSGTFDDSQVDSYTRREGETLIDAKSPNGAFYKPRWDGTHWIEGAADEEKAAWQAAKAAPVTPTQADLLAVEFSAALAAIRLETDLGLAEMTTLLAAGMEG